MPFFMVYSDGDEIRNFLNFIFEEHPPLNENKLIKSFKLNYPDIKIENVKTYMGVIMFQKDKGT
jgi:predicted metal-dependent hydrolase